ncbi:MAG: Small GTP-binding domain protein [Promethearchaeota archaeon]|nr:MAG: Small GTP-binding domain protein [Candidatus Lokiarchaeota archaeon]
MTKSKGNSYSFKISVVGNGFVGKTSLIRKYTQGTFETNYIKTIGAQFSKYKKEIKGDNAILFFWDIAGQDRFQFLRSSFYRDSNGAILVYSLEENKVGEKSLKDIPMWFKEIREYCGDIPIIIFANKVDLVNEDDLDDKEIYEYVKKKEILDYYRTSAKTGKNVIDAFETIIHKLYNKFA